MDRCGFQTTHWSLVERAGLQPGVVQAEALAQLLRHYMPALREHLAARRRFKDHEADDLLQGFLTTKVLEKRIVGQADPQKGRFRAFLATALDRYVNDQLSYQRAKKRAGPAVALDERIDVADDPGEADPFGTAWARQVLADAVERMRAECEANRRPEVWGVFEARILNPTLNDTEPVSYAELVERFGFSSPTQASNVLVTANRMFQRALRSVVSEYEPDDAAIEEEILDLKQILCR